MRFKLDILGVGLSASDTIRLIEPGHSCFEDSGDVRSAESTIDWNCPDINQGCTTVRVSPPVDIPLFTAQWNCLALGDDDICTGAAGITGVLVDNSTGTVRLTFNDTNPLVNGSYVRLGSGVVCNQSCSESQLNLLKGGTSDSSSTGFYMGNRVSIWGSDPPHTIRMSIDDPSFLVDPVPNFAVNPLFSVIDWYQTDRSSTRKELVGLQERSQINVCWNGQGRSNGYTTSAGNLDIIVPGIFSNFGIYPVTRAFGVSRAVPLIVAFTTSSSSQYLSEDGIGEIIISVLNPQALSILTVSGSSLGGVSSVTPPSQDVCGGIFLELWSGEQGTGFPFPRGCWVEVFEINGTVTGSEIHMTFNAGNGLARNTDYQLVVNVVMNSSLITSLCEGSSCDLVKLQTVQNIENAPFEAIELGFAQLSMERSTSSSGPSITSGSLTGGMNRSNTITLTLYAGLIQPGNVLRVIFGPFTQWRLSSLCSAAIILLPGEVGYIGSLPLCEGVALVPGADQLNVIILQLPPDMPAVTDPGRVSIEITGIVSPGTGFYNSAVSVEISDGTTHASKSFVSISSTSLWKYPDASSYMAQIVNQATLTDFTYAGNSGVEMLINFMSGITLSTGMSFSVLLPKGWQCVSVVSDDGRSLFLTSAIWTVSGPNCTTSLNSGFQIYYQSQFYVKIIANVSIEPMSWEFNRFSFEIKSGNYSNIFPFSLYNESSPDFVPSVSVLGSLQDFHIEPVSSRPVWTGSQPGGVFAVFLTPQQAVSDSGFIRLSLPRGYSAADASDLFDYIYAVQERSSDTVNKVPGLVGLSPTSTDPLVVWIQFEGTLLAGNRYAFGITLLTPQQVTSTSIWQIRTADKFRRLIDGTRSETVPLISTMSDSLGPYQAWAPLTVLVEDFRPFSLTGTVSNVTLSFSIPFPFSAAVNARLTLPSGFAVEGAIVSEEMSIDWESSRSMHSSSNVVLFNQIRLSNDSYTIIVPVTIPDRPPVHSLYKFRLEFGFDSTLIENRLVVAESDDTAVGPVRGLDRATVEGLNWIANQTNTIKFVFQTHAIVPSSSSGGKISLKVPSGFEFPVNCSIVPDSGLSGLSCEFKNRIISLRSSSAIAPGILSFYITGTNPATPVSSAGSAFVISTYTNNSLLEVPVSVQAFPVTASMGQAGFVNNIGISRNKFPGRDDRPNYRNSFILFFAPLLANPTKLFLRAPKGFVFDPNCLPYFTFDPTQVFGLGVPWPPNYQIWPSAVELSSCVGFENTASLVLSHPLPLTSQKPYAVRVGAQSNPPYSLSSADSQWQITLDMNQSCVPFQTFSLRTFDPSRSNISGSQTGAGGLNIVTVTVKPFSQIVNGSVVITVPPSSFSIPFDSCNYVASTTCISNGSSIMVSSISPDLVILSFAVMNPPEPGPVDGLWIVQSFASDESPLDESRIQPSFTSIVQSPSLFNVSGYRAEGLVTIPSLKFDLKWPLDINEMYLEIAAPPGIFFNQHASQNDVSVTLNETINTTFSASSTGTILSISFPSIVVVNTWITITVSVLNAESTPLFNFFTASLKNTSTTVTQGVAPGWTVVPQLREVSVILAGPNFAAGSVSNIDFTFSASNPFDELNLVFVGNFKFPQEFLINLTDNLNVTQAMPSNSFAVSLPLINTAIISFNEPIDGGSKLSVSVRGMLLWDIPGPVFVSIVTKRSGVVSNSRLRFPAFYLAGLIQVVSSKISTASQETALSQVLSPNSQLIPYILPRTGESAKLNFTFVLGIPLLNGSFIYISNPPYAFLNGSNVTQTTTGQNSVEARAILPSTISEGLSNFLLITIHGESPSNTNDALTGGFRIVFPIDFQLHAKRSPPGAQIEIELNLLSDIAGTFSFILVAPQGYSFPTNCISKASLGGACSRGPIYDSVLPSAVILFPSGITEVANSLSLYVTTPFEETVKNTWLLIGQDSVGTQTGWGMVSDPFLIRKMENVSVNYPALANVKSQMSFTFRNQVRILAGGCLQVLFPSNFNVDCSTFRKVTMPYYPEDAPFACNSSSSTFNLTFFQDLVPGLFSFTITGTMPASPLINSDALFSMILYDEYSNVLDSNFGFSMGQSLLISTDPSYIYVQALSGDGSLIWQPSPVQGGRQTTVEVRFQVVQQISIQSDGLTVLAAIRITFPETFVSAIQLASDVIDTSENPIMTSVDFSFKNSLLLLLDNTKIVTPGIYGFQFPVFVPDTIPDINIWFLSFCAAQNETLPIASIPLGGFAIGDSYAYTLTQTWSGSFPYTLSANLAALLVVLLY